MSAIRRCMRALGRIDDPEKLGGPRAGGGVPSQTDGPISPGP